MASVLSSLGITGVSAPDPSAYKNIQMESSNLTEAKGEMKSTISNIDMALSGADLVGLPPSYTASVKSLRDEASAAMNSNMTSAQLAAKSTDISAKLKGVTEQQEQQRRADLIKAVTTARDTILARVTAVRADRTTSADLLASFNNLLDRANASVKAAEAKKEGFQVAPPPSPPAPPAPVIASPEELINILDDLNTRKDAEENKTFNWERFWKKMLRIFMFSLMIFSCTTGALLGGIIVSNAYAADYFWAIKLYYFIFGAAFFPISLAYGAFKPPLWLARIAPLQSMVPREVPTSAVPVVKVVAAPKPVSAAKGIVSKIPGASALSKLGLKFGGGDGDAAVATEPKLGFFGYILPDSEPTPEQLSSQKLLRILSITELAILLPVGIYYGAFAIMQAVYKKTWL
jgi:hypothetical protein